MLFSPLSANKQPQPQVSGTCVHAGLVGAHVPPRIEVGEQTENYEFTHAEPQDVSQCVFDKALWPKVAVKCNLRQESQPHSPVKERECV